MGATTIWERWDSMLPDGSINPGEMTSFNHYALGAVVDFMHRVVAGLAPAAPGYTAVEIAPRPGGGLTRAATAHLAPAGKIEVAWERAGGEFRLRVTLPPGTRGIVRLPDGSDPIELAGGTHELRCPFQAAEDDEPRPRRLSMANPEDRAEAGRRAGALTERRREARAGRLT